MKKGLAILAGLMFLLGFLSAETPAATVKSAPKLAPSTTKAAPGAKLNENITVVQQLDMVSFDPINTSDLSNRYIITNIYSYLFAQDEYLNHVPELVKSFKRINDSTWQFEIYKGVKTHDGKDLTADDVVYSLQRTQKGTAIGALFKPVDKISKVGDYTIQITTFGPYPALPTALTHVACGIVPKDYA
jgi:peptide/nickel transport system substrate-binding protein